MERCKYCSIPIDPGVVSAAVQLQEKINSACNDASLIRNFAGATWAGFFLRFIPFIGLVGWIIMILGFIVVPIRLILWQIKYGRLQTSDVDYKRAKRNWMGALGLWLLLIPFILIFVGAVFYSAISGR